MSNTFEKTLRNWAAYDGPKAYQDALLQAHREAVAEAESKLLAEMLVKLVSPFIDEQFGTFDAKGAGEAAITFIENRLSKLTPTAGGDDKSE